VASIDASKNVVSSPDISNLLIPSPLITVVYEGEDEDEDEGESLTIHITVALVISALSFLI
jgi:hypothetical protein